MTSPHDPRRDDLAHTNAIQRLDAALDDQQRLSAETDDAQGGEKEIGIRAELAAANEELAARKAWLGYLEHGQ